jgi:hypothetical protein
LIHFYKRFKISSTLSIKDKVILDRGRDVSEA